MCPPELMINIIQICLSVLQVINNHILYIGRENTLKIDMLELLLTRYIQGIIHINENDIYLNCIIIF
jgi:hypothetical protein